MGDLGALVGGRGGAQPAQRRRSTRGRPVERSTEGGRSSAACARKLPLLPRWGWAGGGRVWRGRRRRARSPRERLRPRRQRRTGAARLARQRGSRRLPAEASGVATAALQQGRGPAQKAAATCTPPLLMGRSCGRTTHKANVVFPPVFATQKNIMRIDKNTERKQSHVFNHLRGGTVDELLGRDVHQRDRPSRLSGRSLQKHPRRVRP